MNRRIVVRSEDEIAEVENRAAVSTSEGRSEYPGMSYEEGLDAAIRWLFEEEADPPFDEE